MDNEELLPMIRKLLFSCEAVMLGALVLDEALSTFVMRAFQVFGERCLCLALVVGFSALSFRLFILMML